MAIPARLLRTFLPALVGAGLVLAACSSDSEDPGPDNNPPSEGGSESSGGSSAGSPEMPEAGSPGGGSGGTGGTGGTNAGGEPDPGSGGTPTEPGGGAGGEGAGPSEPTEGFLRGQELVELNECVTCHQTDFGGLAVFPNITPDVLTGIGSWTDEELADAINNGIDKDGNTMCVQMKRYNFDEGQTADVIEFLRGIPAVSRNITGDCP